MFEDFTIKIKNFTKDKASVKEVKTLKKSICGTQARLVSKSVPLLFTDSLTDRMSGLIPYS